MVTVVSKSRHGVSGPAAGLAVMVAAGIETLGIEAYLLAVIVCGVAQLAAAFLKAGVIAHYFPSSVILLLICVATIPGLLNEIPLASLAAILLVIGYRLARVSLFKAMWREGFWQLVPFIVMIVGLVFTDLLTGTMLGMAVAFFEILIYNYQLNFYREQTSPGSFTIRLTEHMTFLNKASLKRILREVPPACALTIDMSATRILDHDVREVIEDFAAHAEADAIDLKVLGSAGPKIALTDGA